MATSFIRVYTKNSEGMCLGFNRDAVGIPEHPQFVDLIRRHGISLSGVAIDDIPAGGMSERYALLRPPPTRRQWNQLGTLCVGGAYNNAIYEGLVTDGIIVDNTEQSPALAWLDKIERQTPQPL